ncbi:MAG TPA: hypothetical protein VHL57_02225 [Flavobacteriales bacterium]|jgi:hypothetical protein|nr:hypothetical protein [Flavobacteriales bacterium]
MRFLPHEHAAFTAALRESGVDTAMVLFVKRRGRLHVEVPGRTDTFSFFRSKGTSLDANGQWVERTDYFIGEGRGGAVRTWEDVLAAFRTWLATA